MRKVYSDSKTRFFCDFCKESFLSDNLIDILTQTPTNFLIYVFPQKRHEEICKPPATKIDLDPLNEDDIISILKN